MMSHEEKPILNNMARLVNLVFQNIPLQDIQNNSVICTRIPCSYLSRLLNEVEMGLSAQECENIVEAVSDYICDHDKVRMRVSRRKYINVFDLLTDLVEVLLVKQNEVVKCRYTELQSWRALVSGIGEELPVTVKYVIRDQAKVLRQRTDWHHNWRANWRTNYAWNFITQQNNEQLNAILKRGIADHHMHLWGSAPYFELSWIHLMNQVENSGYIQNLRKLDKEQSRHITEEEEQRFWNGKPDNNLYQREKYRFENEKSLVVQHLKAALIRLYLCLRLNEITLGIPTETDAESVLFKSENTEKDGQVPQESQRIIEQLHKLTNYMGDSFQLQMNTGKLQSYIEAVSFVDDDKGLREDYAFNLFTQETVVGSESNYLFSGEHWFNYSMLSDIYNALPRLSQQEHNLYCFYLNIKHRIRKLLLQDNDKVGFSNFQRYERRKFSFTKDAHSKAQLARMAIRDTLINSPHIRELEARVTPGETAEQNRDLILRLEESVLGRRELSSWNEPLEVEASRLLDSYGGRRTPVVEERLREIERAKELQKRYYYVFHFLKRPDTELRKLLSTPMKEYYSEGHDTEYRHYSYRKRLEEIALGIISFRERYPLLASRVGGIDACSLEIGCRAENFASIFRVLSNDIKWRGDELLNRQRIPQPKKTFHVGEDFLDVVDGLRAIDEAICFLNLDCGDRLGHAIALGIDAVEWYQRKNYQINLPIQEYIDNLAWLHHSLLRYHIAETDQLRLFIREQFNYYFRIVYLNHMDSEELRTIMKRGKERYKNDERFRNYKVHDCQFDIKSYYQAWTLRGDHPELYRYGYYDTDEIPIDEWMSYQTNGAFPIKFETRYIAECSILNYYYHYNPSVKREGRRSITVHINELFVKGVVEVQNAMMHEIAERGLSIEVNPTSNVKIGTFRDYAKHPALRFFNQGLTHDPEELEQCPQISISINTDDRGVFFTCIENEYALIASALDELTKEDGTPKYKKREIFDWLDKIREMGLSQGFLTDNNEMFNS